VTTGASTAANKAVARLLADRLGLIEQLGG
jgi:hypothetical protein